MSSRNWCGTLNNYSHEYLGFLRSYESDDLRYFVIGIEVGDSGTPHLQAFFQFKDLHRIPWLKRVLNNDRWHFESMRGTPQQASDYCKKDEEFFEKGELHLPGVGQGRRTDLEAIRTAIDNGATDLELAQMGFGTWCRNYRAFARYRVLSQRACDWRTLEVHVFWGATGVGKTRRAMDFAKSTSSSFNLDPPDGQLWWDGYMEDECLILDEFNGWITLTRLLRVLDGYPLRLPIKGGFQWAHWTTVLITSNQPPSQWYNPETMQKHPGALRRRISSVTKMTNAGPIPTDFNGEPLRGLDLLFQ